MLAHFAEEIQKIIPVEKDFLPVIALIEDVVD